MSPTTTKYNKVLSRSILFSVFYTIIALIMGFFASSQVILIDGIYTLISIVLTYLSIISIRFIDKKDFKNYPFGKEAFEPFVVLAQYGILIVFSITSIVNAVLVVLEGGKTMDLGIGVIYGIVSTIFCYFAFLYLKHLMKKNSTSVEEIEVKQWRFSYLLSIATLIGFIIAWGLIQTPLSSYIQYIDPILAILITLGFVKTAITGVRDSMKELLSATPPPELSSIIKEKVNQVNLKYDFKDMVLRLAKVGRQIIIEIDYVIEEGTKMDSVRIQDQLRNKLEDSLLDVPFEKWLNVNFVGDKKWAE